MTSPPSTPPSKGMMMVAAYRAERLSQRPVLRASLLQSHVARRAARIEGLTCAQPGSPAPAEVPPPVAAAEPERINAGSIFRSLVDTAVAEQQIEAARGQGSQIDAAAIEAVPVVAPETTDIPPAGAASPSEAFIAALPSTEPENVSPQGGPEPAESPDQTASVFPDPPATPAYDPPLAEIGFGPGMLIRLSQLGMYTTSDLANADPAELRSALGEISRLVDVDAWIRSARDTTRSVSREPGKRRVLSEVFG
jgi:predicted flap endonuclease-1-like 5' DNA nuclease